VRGADDVAHVYLSDIREFAVGLPANGMRALRAGRSREGFFTTLADATRLLKRLLKKTMTGEIPGRGMWYLPGSEDYVLGQRKTEAQ